ncbi:MAG: GMC family oxidoreductase, partial [Litoreibacter sp.]|nr:GMC family oxidoreductase [Litoreibacter sp.]
MKHGFDAVIVGAGAGGGAAAWRLCSKGLNVLMLEAGPRFEPSVDYPLDNAGWERNLFPQKGASQARITYGDLGELDPGHADLASWNAVSGRLVAGTKRGVVRGGGYSHVQGVGGSTLHYVGEAHRMHPGSLRLRSEFGLGTDWPLSYEDLEPYYAECEELIGVAGPEAQGARWRSRDFPLPAHPLSPAAQRLAEAGRRIGMDWQANSRAALSQPYDDRPPCNYCGNCSRGCPLGDKGSTDVTFIAKAETSGRLTLETGAAVTRLIAGPGGAITRLEYVQDGRVQQVETPVLILAAGAVQTPRLLLANASADQPDGIANGSGQVGRNFMETLSWHSAGLLDGLEMSHAGLPSDAICWDFNAPGSVAGATGGCRFNSNVQETGLVGPIAYGSRLIEGYGAGFKAQMRNAFGSAISVGAIGETIPDSRSFVALHPEERDTHGVPLPLIHSVLTEDSIALLNFMAAKARELLSEAGVVQLLEEGGSWDS